MTDLLSRPILKVQTPEQPAGWSVVWPAAIAAAWSVAVGLVLCLALSTVAWFAGDTGSFGGAVRVGGLAWLCGQGGAIQAGAVQVTMIPLGFTLLSGLMLYRGGRWAAASANVRSARDVMIGAGVMAAVYAFAGLAVYAATRSADAHAHLVRVLIGTVTIGLVCGGLGLARTSGYLGELLGRVPHALRAMLAGAAAGAALMVMVGGLAVAASVVRHFSEAVTVAEGMRSGMVGGIVLALLGAALVPNAVLFAGAYVAGSGFVVGAGTHVAPTSVHLGTLPAFPLLSAMPRAALPVLAQTVLICLPMVCGAVSGVLCIRRHPVPRLDDAALRGTAAAGLGALGFVALVALSAGSVGPGRMQAVGPDVPPTLLVLAVGFMLGGAVATIAWCLLSPVLTRRRATRGGHAGIPADDEVTVVLADSE